MTPIAGPTEKGSLHVCSFERGEERIDCVWSASEVEEGKFTWATSGAIRYVDPIGRQRTARPRRGKVTIEVGFKPYLVISEVGTRLTY